MRRTIVQSANVSANALADLKSWLAITRSSEDDLLIALLRTGLATCESFIGRAPLLQTVEERIAPEAGSYRLSSHPVRALISADVLAGEQTRTPLDPAQFEFAVDAGGMASVTIARAQDAQALAVRVRVGIAEAWDDMPAALRQGIIRLAAFEYRDRDRPQKERATAIPPVSVTALWRPWRVMRLA